MKIDLIPKPCTFYYEDVNGENIPYELTECHHPQNWHAQHSKNVIVQHSINFAGRTNDAWPIRMLKWVIQKLPNKWKRDCEFSMACTINCGFPVIKYLVDRRGFRFYEACVAYSDLCERCSNMVEDEANGVIGQTYDSRTYCKYCKVIDPEYAMRYKVWRVYRAFKYIGVHDTPPGEAYKDFIQGVKNEGVVL